MSLLQIERPRHAAQLAARLRDCRQDTLALIDGLPEHDLSLQPAPHGRCAKWHLAHTSWFFEQAVLARAPGGVAPEFGAPHCSARAAGDDAAALPSLAELLARRQRVDTALAERIGSTEAAAATALLELGIRHERQHQEWLLADLLCVRANHGRRARIGVPRGCALRNSPFARPCGLMHAHPAPAARLAQPLPADWVPFRGGRVAIGRDDDAGWSVAQPRHEVIVKPFALAARPVSNEDWQAFIAEGGYRRPELWLSEGFRRAQQRAWRAPAYWRDIPGQTLQMTPVGELPLQAQAPVCHISWFEAEAYARWAGKRLPTEAEWEVAAQAQAVAGNLALAQHYRPLPWHADLQAPLRQLYGDVWEWTSSAFAPYPGFRAPARAAGEYDGKFRSGSFVLRGGSCITATVCASTRHFLQPDRRGHFSGLRLAEDRS